MLLPVPDITAAYVDGQSGRPSKDFFNWIKSLDSSVRAGAVSANPWVNVVADFDADPTGTTDSTAAIQEAIDSLPASGGTVIFPVGVYIISDTINIGNGGASTASSTQGIRLEGMGMPWNALAGFDGAGVELRADTGSFAGACMISVNGPINGWGISRIYMHCPAMNVPYGLIVRTGVIGLCEALSISDFNTCQLQSICDDPGISDCYHNRYVGLSLGVPDVNNCIGLELNGAGIASPTHDTDYNGFFGLLITIGGQVNPTIGIKLGVCDSNYFYGVQISGGGSNPGNIAIQFDYTTDNSYPNSNKFFGYDSGFPCAQAGAPPFPNRPQVNEFYGVVQTNGGTPPYGIDNVSWVAGNDARFGYRYLVSNLPSPTNNATMRAFVADATVTTFRSIPVGGGGNFVPVFSDGTDWRIG